MLLIFCLKALQSVELRTTEEECDVAMYPKSAEFNVFLQ